MTLVDVLAMFGNLGIVVACVLNAVLLLTIPRLFKWPDIRRVLVLFGLVFTAGTVLHASRVALYLFGPIPALAWTNALSAATAAVLLLAAVMAAYNVLHGRHLTVLTVAASVNDWCDSWRRHGRGGP